MSTLSNWFRDRPYTPNEEAKRRIETGRYRYGLKRQAERLKDIENIKNAARMEIGEFTERDLWMMGIGLWLGEGSKTTEQIRLANSNPDVVKLWVKWLTEVCGLGAENIFLTLHCYPDTDEDACKQYWAQTIGLDTVRFGKTQVDQRKDKSSVKRSTLQYGTVHISVRSAGNPEKGVQLYRRLRGWVSAILDDR